MSSESVCEVALSWVEVESFHTRLLGVVDVTCGDLHEGTASVHQILASLGENATETLTMIQQAFGDQSLSRAQVFQWHARFSPVANQLKMTNTQGDSEAAQLVKLLHEFKTSSVRIDVGPFTTLLRRWELVMRYASGF
jgi:hypothetical protein